MAGKILSSVRWQEIPLFEESRELDHDCNWTKELRAVSKTKRSVLKTFTATQQHWQLMNPVIYATLQQETVTWWNVPWTIRIELKPQNTKRFMDLELDSLQIFTISTKHNTCAWWDCLFEYQKYILEHAVAPCFLRSLHISRDRLLSSPPAVFSLAARSTCGTTTCVRRNLNVHEIPQIITLFGFWRWTKVGWVWI